MRAFTLWESRAVESQVHAAVAYVDVGNAAVTASFQTADFEWRRRALELTFDCAAIDGPDAGRPARPADASLIAELLAAQARRVLSRGATHRVLYSWPGSPLHERCAGLAEQVGELGIQTDLAEPPDRSGVHTDPLYL